MAGISGDIERAASRLRAGDLVAFPTETVYGLGVDAGNEAALKKLFALKGRPRNHPVIVHFARVEQLTDWIRELPAAATRLAEAFWPGPMTLVLHKAPQVSPLVTGGQQTIAVRVPSHPVARDLLQAFGGGVAAPSANRFGHVSPTRSEHVAVEFAGEDVLILAGDGCEVGIESTIVSLLDEHCRILRPGHITAAEIRRATALVCSQARISGPRVSGALERHYAPHTPAILVDSGDWAAAWDESRVAGLRVGGLVSRLRVAEGVPHVRLPNTPPDYARGLYAALRDLDRMQLDRLLVELPGEGTGWEAVNDRLRRACSR